MKKKLLTALLSTLTIFGTAYAALVSPDIVGSLPEIGSYSLTPNTYIMVQSWGWLAREQNRISISNLMGDYVPYSGWINPIYFGNSIYMTYVWGWIYFPQFANGLRFRDESGHYVGITSYSGSQLYLWSDQYGVNVDISKLTRDRQVYFPDATGTFVLDTTLNNSLSWYVPYTGATNDIELGNHTLNIGGWYAWYTVAVSGSAMFNNFDNDRIWWFNLSIMWYWVGMYWAVADSITWAGVYWQSDIGNAIVWVADGTWNWLYIHSMHWSWAIILAKYWLWLFVEGSWNAISASWNIKSNGTTESTSGFVGMWFISSWTTLAFPTGHPYSAMYYTTTTLSGARFLGFDGTNYLNTILGAKFWNNYQMVLRSGGNVGIMTNNPTQALTVSGNINVTTGNNIYDGDGNPYITGYVFSWLTNQYVPIWSGNKFASSNMFYFPWNGYFITWQYVGLNILDWWITAKNWYFSSYFYLTWEDNNIAAVRASRYNSWWWMSMHLASYSRWISIERASDYYLHYSVPDNYTAFVVANQWSGSTSLTWNTGTNFRVDFAGNVYSAKTITALSWFCIGLNCKNNWENIDGRIIVSSGATYTGLKQAVDWVNANATHPYEILIAPGNMTITDTITVNSTYPVTIRGGWFETTTLQAWTGLAGKPMFEVKTKLELRDLSLDASTLASYGSSANEDWIKVLANSGQFIQFENVGIYNFNKGIYLAKNSELRVFNSVLKNNVAYGAYISGWDYRSSNTDYTNTASNLTIYAGSGKYFSTEHDRYTTNSWQIGITYYGNTYTNFKRVAIFNDIFETASNGTTVSWFNFTLQRDANVEVYGNVWLVDKKPALSANIQDGTYSQTYLANTWTITVLTGVTIESNSKWQLSGNRLYYMSDTPRAVDFWISAGVSTPSQPANVKFATVKNGNTTWVLYGLMQVTLDTNGRSFSTSRNGTVPEMKRGDYLELYGYSISSTKQVTIQNATIMLKSE